MNIKSYALPVLVAFIALSLTGVLAAQSGRGTLAGTVVDATGAVVPGTKVTLTHEATGRVHVAETSPVGRYSFVLLPPGEYRMQAEFPGFGTWENRLIIRWNQVINVPIELVIGRDQTVVEVPAEAQLLRPETAELGTVIDERQVAQLPLDGRNFYELSLLAPGTVGSAEGSAGSVRGDFALNSNGAREGSNQFLLDGVYIGDPKLNGVGVTPAVDAIREFSVVTGNYDASYGRNAGAQITVASRSGGNEFHGTVYEFMRNDVIAARNFFDPRDQQAPKYERHQFGGSLGGPLVPEKTFFFADYEGTLLDEGVTRLGTVPTAAERSGDFSALNPNPASCADPGAVCDPLTGTPFPGNIIPSAFIHPVGAAIAGLYPDENRIVPGGNFASSPLRDDTQNRFDARLDHLIGDGSDLTFRYSLEDRDLFEPFSGDLFSPLPGYGTDIDFRAQNFMASETHAFSPSLFNDARVSFNRVEIGVAHENQGTSVNNAVGLPEFSSNPRDFGLSFIRISGFSPLGDEFNNPQQSTSNTFQLVDHMTYVRGAHFMNFGADFRTIRQDGFRDVQSRGFLNFAGVFTGNALADLLLGLPTVTGGATLDNQQQLRTESIAVFINDRIQLRPNLTLSAGVRYEFVSPPVDRTDRANLFDTASQTLVQVGTNGVPRSGYQTQRSNFAPRIGLAWTLAGEEKTVVRAGYGIYFDQPALASGEGLYFNAPFFDFRVFFTDPGSGTLLTLTDPFPASFPFPTPPSALAFQPDLETPYMQHWSVNVQQSLGPGRIVEAGYTGTKGTHLLTARDINQPSASPVVPNFRPLPQFGDVNIVESRANSSYNSLQVRFQQDWQSGLTLLGGYTWSKSNDDASNFFPSSGDPNFPQDSFNVGAERGRSNFDARHRLSISYVYELPFTGAATEGIRKTLLSGWQTAGVLNFQSGRPFTAALLPEIDNSNTGFSILGFGGNDRPNLVGDTNLAQPGPNGWFDASAFAFPAFGSFGNAGRNILEGPGFQTFNLSLIKETKVREVGTFQFRAEFFNALNRTNFHLPDNFLGSPTFGRIQSAGDPRRIQFGFKYLF